MAERVIAICTPELHGDALWTLPATRELARRHGLRADYWLSGRGRHVADLLGVQSFVRNVMVDEHWRIHGDCSVSQLVGGQVITEPPGRSHTMQIAHDPLWDYAAVYQLGFSTTLGLSGTLLDYFCDLAGVGRQGHHLDLPAGCPEGPVPEGPFVALCVRAFGEMQRTGWGDVLREFVKACPIPVVEAGSPGTALATDLGAIDRTRKGFLEMAGVISKCKYFIGNVSAPLVVADAFPNVFRIGLTEGGINLNACTLSGGMNFYPRASTHLELLQYIKEAK